MVVFHASPPPVFSPRPGPKPAPQNDGADESVYIVRWPDARLDRMLAFVISGEDDTDA